MDTSVCLEPGNQSKNICSALDDDCQWWKELFMGFVVNGQKLQSHRNDPWGSNHYRGVGGPFFSILNIFWNKAHIFFQKKLQIPSNVTTHNQSEWLMWTCCSSFIQHAVQPNYSVRLFIHKVCAWWNVLAVDVLLYILQSSVPKVCHYAVMNDAFFSL